MQHHHSWVLLGIKMMTCPLSLTQVQGWENNGKAIKFTNEEHVTKVSTDSLRSSQLTKEGQTMCYNFRSKWEHLIFAASVVLSKRVFILKKTNLSDQSVVYVSCFHKKKLTG